MQKGVVRKRKPAPLSEYGRQLQDKQNLKRQYNLREHQFKRYVQETMEKKASGGNRPEMFLQRLEARLDSVVFRAGIADTRKAARQMVSHGHFLVNGRRTTVPSHTVKKGDALTVRPSSLQKTLFKTTIERLKKFQTPAWLEVNKETLAVKVTGIPTLQELSPTVEIPLIFEFYSR